MSDALDQEFSKFDQKFGSTEPEKSAEAAKAENVVDETGTEGADGAGEKEAPEANDQPKREPNIPLSRHKQILQQQREAREAAEERLREAEAKIAELSPSAQASMDELKDLKDTLPEEAYQEIERAFRARDARLDKAMKAIERYEQAEQRRAEDARLSAQTEVEAAIAANETLSAWQRAASAENADDEAVSRWEAVVQHDKVLRTMPAWRDKPLNVRFSEAVKRASSDLGIAVPSTPQKRELPSHQSGAPSSLSNLPSGRTPDSPSSGAPMSFTQALAAVDGLTFDQAAQKLLMDG